MTEETTTDTTTELVGVAAMSDDDLALGLAAVAEVKQRLAKHEQELRAAISSRLRAGDRKVAALPDGTVVGRVTRTAGRAPVAQISDPEAFLAHVAWVAPGEVQVVPEHRAVRSSYTAAVLKDVTATALETGELPAWAELTEPGAPGLQVGKPTPAQAAAIAAAWTSGALAPVLAIGGAA